MKLKALQTFIMAGFFLALNDPLPCEAFLPPVYKMKKHPEYRRGGKREPVNVAHMVKGPRSKVSGHGVSLPRIS